MLPPEARSTTTGKRHFKPEHISRMLREAEIKLAGGVTTLLSFTKRHPDARSVSSQTNLSGKIAGRWQNTGQETVRIHTLFCDQF
jgi:hypothetical protein